MLIVILAITLKRLLVRDALPGFHFDENKQTRLFILPESGAFR